MMNQTIGEESASQAAGSRLRGEVVRTAGLSEADAETLFELFSRYYRAVNWPRFEADLREKDYVILLRDSRTGSLQGFSTQKILRATVLDHEVRAVFSGDTVIDPAYWGEQELVRSWCSFAGRVRSEEPETPLYWFLITKGYRTYLYLPVFYHDYYPRHDGPTPVFDQAVLDVLARSKFGSFYQSRAGTIRFPRSMGHLAPELAVVPPGRQEDLRVRFFLDRNPDYAKGTELACLTEVCEANMKSIARRFYLEGNRLGPLKEDMLLAAPAL